MIRLVTNDQGEASAEHSHTWLPSEMRQLSGFGPFICVKCGAEDGESSAEESDRLDMDQPAPNDRAVETFRREMARTGNPHIATIAAMDCWLNHCIKAGAK